MNVNEPEAVGVPESRPAELRVNPVGRLPELTDHVIGVVPEAESVRLYDCPACPAGSDDVVIVGAVPVTGVDDDVTV